MHWKACGVFEDRLILNPLEQPRASITIVQDTYELSFDLIPRGDALTLVAFGIS